MRVGEAEMERLVGEPMRLVRGGDVRGGIEAFERLLATETASQGPQSLSVADHLGAFGVMLYTHGQFEFDEKLRRRAVPYLRRSVEAYRAARGPRHPELAVALHDLAGALIALNPADPPAEADAALAEAYAIRVASLGAGDPATSGALKRLAEIRGLPRRTRGDPRRIEDAAALFRQVIALRRAHPHSAEESASSAALAIADMYLAHGLAAPAAAAVGDALADARSRGPAGDAFCGFDALRAAGLADRIRRLDRDRGDSLVQQVDAQIELCPTRTYLGRPLQPEE